jgi:hypothetical protein
MIKHQTEDRGDAQIIKRVRRQQERIEEAAGCPWLAIGTCQQLDNIREG